MSYQVNTILFFWPLAPAAAVAVSRQDCFSTFENNGLPRFSTNS
jgi:hypothetical protein